MELSIGDTDMRYKVLVLLDALTEFVKVKAKIAQAQYDEEFGETDEEDAEGE